MGVGVGCCGSCIFCIGFAGPKRKRLTVLFIVLSG